MAHELKKTFICLAHAHGIQCKHIPAWHLNALYHVCIPQSLSLWNEGNSFLIFLRCFGWKVFNWGKGLLLGMYFFSSIYSCCWYATLFFFFSSSSPPGTTPGTENEFWLVFMQWYPWVHGIDHQSSKRAAISIVLMASLILATKVILANVQQL